jgi:hypothetical protein
VILWTLLEVEKDIRDIFGYDSRPLSACLFTTWTAAISFWTTFERHDMFRDVVLEKIVEFGKSETWGPLFWPLVSQVADLTNQDLGVWIVNVPDVLSLGAGVAEILVGNATIPTRLTSPVVHVLAPTKFRFRVDGRMMVSSLVKNDGEFNVVHTSAVATL